MNDPIIEEVRAHREKLVRDKGGLAGLFEYLREKEKEHPQRLLRQNSEPHAGTDRKLANEA